MPFAFPSESAFVFAGILTRAQQLAPRAYGRRSGRPSTPRSSPRSKPSTRNAAGEAKAIEIEGIEARISELERAAETRKSRASYRCLVTTMTWDREESV